MEDNQEKLEKQAEILEKELEISADLEMLKNEEVKVEGKTFYYTKVILSGVLDQILALGLALIFFGLLTVILNIAGYQIVGREEMFLIMYVISNILYYPLTQIMLSGKTLGKKIMFR